MSNKNIYYNHHFICFINNEIWAVNITKWNKLCFTFLQKETKSYIPLLHFTINVNDIYDTVTYTKRTISLQLNRNNKIFTLYITFTSVKEKNIFVSLIHSVIIRDYYVRYYETTTNAIQACTHANAHSLISDYMKCYFKHKIVKCNRHWNDYNMLPIMITMRFVDKMCNVICNPYNELILIEVNEGCNQETFSYLLLSTYDSDNDNDNDIYNSNSSNSNDDVNGFQPRYSIEADSFNSREDKYKYLSHRRSGIVLKKKTIEHSIHNNNNNNNDNDNSNSNNNAQLIQELIQYDEAQYELLYGKNESIINHPNAKKFKFEVIINKFFSSRVVNYMYFSKHGCFAICLSNKNPFKQNISNESIKPTSQQNYLEFSLSSIQRVRVFNFDSPRLEFTIHDAKGKEQSTSIDFLSLIEKFIFRSIVYTHLLADEEIPTKNMSISLKVSIITWNVSSMSLPDHMFPCFTEAEVDNVDIIAVGVQECAYWKKTDWIRHLTTILEHYNFVTVASVEMWQMFSIIFIKKKWSKFIDCLYTDSQAMGVGNVIGNKGGMIISFKLLGYQFVFINCHFAPKPHRLHDRIKMAKNLVKAVKLPNIPFMQFDVAGDYVFWFGDMNFRVDGHYEDNLRILKGKKDEAIKMLFDKEQLTRVKKENLLFYDFYEPKVDFYPTYKRSAEPTEMQLQIMKGIRQMILNENENKDDNDDEQRKRTLNECKRDDNEVNNETQTINNYNNNKTNIDKLIHSITTDINNNTTTTTHNVNEHNDTNMNNNDLNKYSSWEIESYINKEDQSPSWCDRILTKTIRSINTLSYTSLPYICNSDHVPVEAKYELFLTIPLLSPLPKPQPKELDTVGRFIYTNIKLKYDFDILLEELNFNLPTPYKVELSCYFELNKNKSISSSDTLLTKANEVDIKDLDFSFSHELIFKYPQSKAMNIFFVVECVYDNNRKRVEMGYAKYSLELVEKEGQLPVSHVFVCNVYLFTRKVGELAFKAEHQLEV